MRDFFRRSTPPLTRLLLVESGSRSIFDRLIPTLYRIHGGHMELDLVTCFAGEPEGFHGRVYRVQDYSGPAGRKQLFAELAARQYTAAGMICSGEPIMTKWKWALGARLPVKVFVVNENADLFWLDWGHWRAIVQFVMYRAGITGAAAVPTLARLLFFPVTLAYLLLFAAFVHLRRRVRML